MRAQSKQKVTKYIQVRVVSYQSIHTTIIGADGKMVEIQIRTKIMDRTAEIGVASHWMYKEGKKTINDISTDIKWLRELIEILKNE